MSIKHNTYLLLLLSVILFSGCMTYYRRNLALMEAYEQKNFVRAEELLNNKKWEKKKRNILLYYLNKGTVLHMLGKYNESNKFFQEADYYIEDYHKNYGFKALSYLSNPAVVPYSGENYEKVLLHYYATLNYLMLNNLDEALVECKRMLLTMENISTYFKKDNKLHRDAFTHLLLGIIYDAKKDNNNAFIAYRNALETYQNDYVPLLGTQVPLQLKKDLMRTAYASGFMSDLKKYEDEFNMTYDRNETNNSSLICFWNNGLCPVKEQGSITFLITNMGNGYAVFTNLELGLSFPFYVGNDKEKMDGLIRMKFLRVSYPKMVSRPVSTTSANARHKNASYSFELSEDIDAIAHQTLQDRMTKELGEMIIRLAVKKLAEAQAAKANQGLGAVVNIANTISEQADTRNWQTLPASINYCRIPLDEGKNTVTVSAKGASYTDTVNVTASNYPKTFFHSFNTFGN